MSYGGTLKYAWCDWRKSFAKFRGKYQEHLMKKHPGKHSGFDDKGLR